MLSTLRFMILLVKKKFQSTLILTMTRKVPKWKKMRRKTSKEEREKSGKEKQ